MKLYPDGIAEGTPEELAAFKHIDAALAGRGKPKAITAAPPKPRPKHHGKGGADALAQRRAVRDWAQRHGYAVAPRGVIPAAVLAAHHDAHQAAQQ